MILIVTGRRDGHVEAVSRHLSSAGAEWVRLNTEDFAANVEVDLAPSLGAGRLFIKDSQREVVLEDVTAVWFRKPDPVSLQHLEIEPAALDYVEAEFTEVIQGLYALIDRAFWINDPFSTRRAHRKLLQLRTAERVGFAVPPTIVTNLSEAAVKFAHRVGGGIAIKSLGTISVVQAQAEQFVQYGIFTRRISTTDLVTYGDHVRNMPTLFQKFIPKISELRITCVGDRVFACRIKPRLGDLTSDDYRFDTPNLEHVPVECPELTERLHAYMRAFDLNFGCFDFVESASEGVMFLECNCNGQWLWVQERTGQPIGQAIADELLRHAV